MTYPPPPQMPQPRRSSTTRTVLLVVGIVLAVCCIGGTVAGYFVYRGVKGAVVSIGAVRSAADAFLGDLEQGRVDAAYARLCAATRRAYPPERFVQTVNTHGTPVRHTITNTNVSNYNGHEGATVTATLTYGDGSTDNHTFTMVDEGGWKVCGNPY